MKKFLITFILLVTCYVSLVTPISAQGETESTEGAQSVRDAIRKRVEEKLDKLSKSPRALFGQLKEVADTTLKITTADGEALAGTAEDTKYFRVTKGKQTTVKFEELVLGDYLVAMGYKNGNSVVDAKRVISFDVNPVVEKKAVYGTVRTSMNGTIGVQTSSGMVSISTDDGTTVTTKSEKGLEETDVDAINTGDKILALGTPNSKKVGTVAVDRIHIMYAPEKPKETETTPTPTKAKASPTPTKKLTPTPTTGQ